MGGVLASSLDFLFHFVCLLIVALSSTVFNFFNSIQFHSRPLFKPCRCSGSIGLTHQDCLTSWLDVTHGDGRCELCSTRFQFAPQYADGTPDRLSPSEVYYRLLRRLGAKWLPRGLRALFAACLWLVILPLSTSYI